MAKEQLQTQENQAPLKEGEFHRINGIGPGIEKRLHAADIQTFNQLAALSPEEITDALNGLVGVKPDLILRKDWTGQAARYALELENSKKANEPEETSEPQHYESYIVELLLDEVHNVLRTRITQVKTGTKDGWAGWEAGKVDHWIAARANLRGTQAETHLPLTRPVSEAAKEQEPAYPREIPYRKANSAQRETPAAAPVEPPAPPKINLSIREVKIMDPAENRAGRFFDSGIPFEVHLALDLSHVDRASEEVLEYRANVIARRLGSAEQFEAGEVTGICNLTSSLRIIVPVHGLPAGTYQLDTFVLVDLDRSNSPQRESLRAMSEGGVIQVRASDRD